MTQRSPRRSRTNGPWNTLIVDCVKAEVEDGHVTLRGEVDWSYQACEVARAVRHLAGVRGVSNLIMLKSIEEQTAAVVERQVHDAIARMADLDLRSIWASNNTVYLHGRVCSLAERRIAQRARRRRP